MSGYLSVTLMDAYGRETSKRFEFQDKVLLADYVLNANGLLTDLAAVTDLEIIRASMVLTDGLSIPESGVEGSNIDVGATFSGFVEGGDGKKATLKVPGIKPAFVGPLGIIDVEDVTVAAFLEHWLEGDNDDFYLSDGETISDWIVGTLDK